MCVRVSVCVREGKSVCGGVRVGMSVREGTCVCA